MLFDKLMTRNFGQLASIPPETRDELAGLRTQVSALTVERDGLRGQVPALMLECDRARGQVRTRSTYVMSPQ